MGRGVPDHATPPSRGLSLRALAIVHQPDAGPGVFAEAISSRGLELDQWLPAKQAAKPPGISAYDAAFVFGGAMNVDYVDRHPWLVAEKALLKDLLKAGTPLLGVCLGAQLISEAAGATPTRASEPEIGWHEVDLTPDGANDPVVGALAPRFTAFQWHSYQCPLPANATALATSPVCLQAYRVGDAAWGLQFHPEVTADDAESWITDYRQDDDAVQIGIDPDALREQTRTAIDGWNELGRGICERFLDAVAS